MSVQNNYAVTVKDLEKSFGSFTAVNRISFDVRPGEIFGFLGPNGAGKSTTIRMLCGIIAPTSGQGSVGGYDIIRQQNKIKQNIGYMSQKFSLYDDLTVEENIDFYSGIYGIAKDKKSQRKDRIIQMAGIQDFRSKLTKTLSGGWKQRLALGCALIHEPKIIFLDEPTSGVDPITRSNFWNIIKSLAKQGVTVFVTTHYMDEAENCDRMVLIYKGSIIAMGTAAQMKTEFMKNEVLEIRVNNPEEWAAKIMRSGIAKETALFGVNIHAVVQSSARAVGLIKEMLQREREDQFAINRIAPSLEDVFVSLIEDYDKTGHESQKN